jgi:hypothetical protein
MREIRQSGSEGGVARKRHPYPYPSGDRYAVIGQLGEPALPVIACGTRGAGPIGYRVRTLGGPAERDFAATIRMRR